VTPNAYFFFFAGHTCDELEQHAVVVVSAAFTVLLESDLNHK
jgi:hypothetical protein